MCKAREVSVLNGSLLMCSIVGNLQIISAVTGDRTSSRSAGWCMNFGRSEAGCLRVMEGAYDVDASDEEEEEVYEVDMMAAAAVVLLSEGGGGDACRLLTRSSFRQ